jgi:integrase
MHDLTPDPRTEVTRHGTPVSVGAGPGVPWSNDLEFTRGRWHGKPLLSRNTAPRNLLATRRQLRALGKRPGGQDLVALRLHRIRQEAVKKRVQERHRRGKGKPWQENGLVFASAVGTELDAHNVRRGFRKVVKAAGLVPEEWTPREMRHSFVSLLSDARVPIEDIARLCGHSGTAVTEQVYRYQIRPVIVEGALAMESIFSARGSEA